MSWNDLILNTDFIAYLHSCNYKPSKKDSCKKWLAFKNEQNKDDIFVYFKYNLNYFKYFNKHIKNDAGNVINFVMNRLNGPVIPNSLNKKDLISTANILNQFNNNPKSIQPFVQDFIKANADQEPFNPKLHRLEPFQSFGILYKRLLTKETLLNPLFKNRILSLNKNVPPFNAPDFFFPAFPTFINDDIAGVIVHYTNKKLFLPNSNRDQAFWHSNVLDSSTFLILCENAIDALSHHQLFNQTLVFAYAASMGRPSNNHFPEFKKFALDNGLINIALANDNDPYGQLFNLAYALFFCLDAPYPDLNQDKTVASFFLPKNTPNLIPLFDKLSDFNKRQSENPNALFKRAENQSDYKIFCPFSAHHLHFISVAIIEAFPVQTFKLSLLLPSSKDWNQDLANVLSKPP